MPLTSAGYVQVIQFAQYDGTNGEDFAEFISTTYIGEEDGVLTVRLQGGDPATIPTGFWSSAGGLYGLSDTDFHAQYVPVADLENPVEPS